MSALLNGLNPAQRAAVISTAPVQLCECGCGQSAPIAKITSKRDGHIKGQPMRFVHGHESKSRNHGPSIRKDGYIYVKIDGKWEAEHRVIAERILGRKLTPEETVHHINGVRTDNSPENLEILDVANHRVIKSLAPKDTKFVLTAKR